MGKACFQPTYEEAVAIAGRRIAERREREAIQDAKFVAELFGVAIRKALEDSEREARKREEA